MPADIMGAIKARWVAQGLDTSVGALYEAEGPANPAATWARISEISGDLRSTSGPVDVETIEFQFSIFSPTPETARTKGDLVAAAFDRCVLTFDNGTLSEFRRHGRMLAVDNSLGTQARPVYHRIWLYKATVGRQR